MDWSHLVYELPSRIRYSKKYRRKDRNMTWRRGSRSKQLLNNLKETRGYWVLKEEALDRTLWRTCFGSSYGPVTRETTQWNNVIYSVRKKFCCRSCPHVKCESKGVINHGCNCNSPRTISEDFTALLLWKHCRVALYNLAALRKHTSGWRWQSGT
jgi:hypothetical protein